MRTDADQLGKELLRKLLASSCQVETEAEIAHDPQTVDVLATPDRLHPPEARGVGCLARMIEGPTMLEPFRNTIGAVHLDTTQRRQLALQHKRNKGATG